MVWISRRRTRSPCASRIRCARPERQYTLSYRLSVLSFRRLSVLSYRRGVVFVEAAPQILDVGAQVDRLDAQELGLLGLGQHDKVIDQAGVSPLSGAAWPRRPRS
jgi:hypothetical protein